MTKQEITNDKNYEYLIDASSECGCIERGDWCFDKDGDPTHASDEDCNE